MSEPARCEAHVYRGEWSTLRREMCGKPAKGERVMWRGGVTKRPACGVHLRAKEPMWWGDNGGDLGRRNTRPRVASPVTVRRAEDK